MNTLEILQLLGSGIYLLLGLSGVYIGMSIRRFCRYGRETLLAISCFILSLVPVRMALAFEWISPKAALGIASMNAAVFAAILIQTVILHWLEHRAQGIEHYKEREGVQRRIR